VFVCLLRRSDLSLCIKQAKISGPGVEVALDPSEMENIDDEKIKQLFEQQKAVRSRLHTSDQLWAALTN